MNVLNFRSIVAFSSIDLPVDASGDVKPLFSEFAQQEIDKRSVLVLDVRAHSFLFAQCIPNTSLFDWATAQRGDNGCVIWV